MIRTSKTAIAQLLVASMIRQAGRELNHCGDCAHFELENIDGFGWCALTQEEQRCSDDGCTGWREYDDGVANW